MYTKYTSDSFYLQINEQVHLHIPRTPFYMNKEHQKYCTNVTLDMNKEAVVRHLDIIKQEVQRMVKSSGCIALFLETPKKEAKIEETSQPVLPSSASLA